MAITDLIPWRRRAGEIRRRGDYVDWVDSFHEEMDRMLGRFFRSFDIEPFTGRGLLSSSSEFMPRVDVNEDEKEIKVKAELPGMDEKDIDLSLDKDSLTIRGEKKEETEDKGKDYYRSERRYGSFQRVVPLSTEVDEAKVEANFKKGILTVTLPKTPEAQRKHKRIEVKAT